jgi:hypothetical protein
VAVGPELGRFRLSVKNILKPKLGKKYSEKYSRNTPAEYFQPEFVAVLPANGAPDQVRPL